MRPNGVFLALYLRFTGRIPKNVRGVFSDTAKA
jgi:hypothetical protein